MNNSEPEAISQALRRPVTGWAIPIGIAALAFGYLGLGIPQHFYQPLFAVLTLLVLYRHGHLTRENNIWHWPAVSINFLALCLLYKLLIGGGVSYPLDWLKVPNIVTTSPSDAAWYEKLVPSFRIEMLPVPKISDWSIDITKIQTLLLLATLAGAVFRFQPFASLTALALLFVSIPTLVAFQWDWVILFLVSAGASFYLQSPVSRLPASTTDA
jgi:hypothetical protein